MKYAFSIAGHCEPVILEAYGREQLMVAVLARLIGRYEFTAKYPLAFNLSYCVTPQAEATHEAWTMVFDVNTEESMVDSLVQLEDIAKNMLGRLNDVDW